MSDANTNPFEVLRLDPATPAAEVVRQAGRLRQRADRRGDGGGDPAGGAGADRPARGAAAARIADAPRRVSRLGRRWSDSRPPFGGRRCPSGEAAPACPPPDLAEVAALLRPLAAAELDAEPPPFEPVGEAEDRAEIVRQTVEGVWQALPFDMRA